MKDWSRLKGTQSCHPLPRLMPYPVSFKQSNLDPHQNETVSSFAHVPHLKQIS